MMYWDFVVPVVSVMSDVFNANSFCPNESPSIILPFFFKPGSDPVPSFRILLKIKKCFARLVPIYSQLFSDTVLNSSSNCPRDMQMQVLVFLSYPAHFQVFPGSCRHNSNCTLNVLRCPQISSIFLAIPVYFSNISC
jgi:hypothetical protein